MVELCRAPGRGVVAEAAVLSGLDVGCRLAVRSNTVVTALAAATDFLMVESCGGQVCRGRVTLRAPIGAHHVIRGFRSGANQ